jgi:mannose-6-phosphate isomerase-like protein (cupin superfamily)
VIHAAGKAVYQHFAATTLKILPLLVLSSAMFAQEWKVDPTWLHRYVPALAPVTDPAGAACHRQSIFGEGDAGSRPLVSVSRFEEVTIEAHGNCPNANYDREEEIYYVLFGNGALRYGGKTYSMRANDFTYLPPRVQHSMANDSGQPLRFLVMGFRIPASIAIGEAPPQPRIVNLDDVKEETVEGHPTSVLYKLLLGPKTGKRDAIDDAYVVTSLFWMNFAPSGTNFPHHHETAEEIYLMLDGEGEMVAGGGMDGLEGRHAAKAGDAYYFRQNCTVGFYNQNKGDAKAHILAVRSKVPLPKDAD